MMFALFKIISFAKQWMAVEAVYSLHAASCIKILFLNSFDKLYVNYNMLVRQIVM